MLYITTIVYFSRYPVQTFTRGRLLHPLCTQRLSNTLQLTAQNQSDTSLTLTSLACRNSAFPGLAFTQEDLDMVLYGYARNRVRERFPGHAISGLRTSELNHGKFT